MENKQRCYFDKKGKYQNIYNKLHKELVPFKNSADTVQGELIRAIGKLYYEYCNNGNCNAVSEIRSRYSNCYYDEDDDSEFEVYYEVSELYSKFLDLIQTVIPNSSNLCESVRNIITSNHCYFNESEKQKYINLTDIVISYVVKNLNKEIEFPVNYIKCI